MEILVDNPRGFSSLCFVVNLLILKAGESHCYCSRLLCCNRTNEIFQMVSILVNIMHITSKKRNEMQKIKFNFFYNLSCTCHGIFSPIPIRITRYLNGLTCQFAYSD